MRECGFAYPPADGTRDRETIDRFRDFLSVAGAPARPGHPYRLRSAAERYHVRFLAWRIGQVHNERCTT